jgi:hypothetical protein
MNKQTFLWLALGIAIGISLSSMWRFNEAAAQAQIQTGQWQLGVDSGGQTSAAWRMNVATGYMEICTAIGGQPKCYKMPPPSN